MRIQKYKIIDNPPFLKTVNIFCDVKKRKVESIECKSCEYFVKVKSWEQEIICNGETL